MQVYCMELVPGKALMLVEPDTIDLALLHAMYTTVLTASVYLCCKHDVALFFPPRNLGTSMQAPL